jgi:hypothetical protein
MDLYQHHYTDDSGFKAIHSRPTWLFRAAQPPGDHRFGAYFTTLPPGTPKLATRLRIPKRKIAFVFCFVDAGDLVPIEGDRGRFIFFSRDDYVVDGDRQVAAGARETVEEHFHDRGN